MSYCAHCGYWRRLDGYTKLCAACMGQWYERHARHPWWEPVVTHT